MYEIPDIRLTNTWFMRMGREKRISFMPATLALHFICYYAVTFLSFIIILFYQTVDTNNNSQIMDNHQIVMLVSGFPCNHQSCCDNVFGTMLGLWYNVHERNGYFSKALSL